MITKRQFSILAAATLALGAASVQADEYQDTINIFRKAEESGKFFGKAYGYAVFPTIGRAASASAEPTAPAMSTRRASTSATCR